MSEQESKFCGKTNDCDMIKGLERTRTMFQKRIDDRDSVLEEIGTIIGLNKGLTFYDIPGKLAEFLDTRGDKAKLVSENKRLLKENQELAYQIHTLKNT